MAILEQIQELTKRMKLVLDIKREKDEDRDDFMKKCEGLRLDLNNVLGADVIVAKGRVIPFTKDTYALSVDAPIAKREEVVEIIEAVLERHNIKKGV